MFKEYTYAQCVEQRCPDRFRFRCGIPFLIQGIGMQFNILRYALELSQLLDRRLMAVEMYFLWVNLRWVSQKYVNTYRERIA